MGRRSSKAFPEPQLHRSEGLLQLRVDGREFWLGKPGTRTADERRAAILAAWGANGGSPPAKFRLDTKKPRKVVPKVTKVSAKYYRESETRESCRNNQSLVTTVALRGSQWCVGSTH